MSIKTLLKIPSGRRDTLFAEIRCLVNETDAMDRSLDGIGEGMAIDECLEEIVGILNAEARHSRRHLAAVA